jgi:uncharacterized membrane protein
MAVTYRPRSHPSHDSHHSVTHTQVGGFMALLGLLVLPANLLVGESSGHGYEDRTIIVTSQAVTILGLLVVISYWGEYNEFQVRAWLHDPSPRRRRCLVR